jgi:hypothetical protein
MTLIIGAECQDGIVLGSDRKLRRGEEVDYSDKIFEMGNSIIGCAGLTGIRDDFLLIMSSEIARIRPRSLYELKVIAEDIDASVGGKPQVLMVKNGNSPVETLADNIVEEMEKKAKETKKNLKNKLELL